MTAMWFRRSPRAEKIAGGFQFLEGPVWRSQTSDLLFSDIPASRIHRLHQDAIELFRAPTGKANGNTLDREGRLVTCEHENRRVSRTEADGSVTPLATHFRGKRLNSPNDVVVRKRDGSVYFTDPPYGVPPEARELDFQGIYRIDGANELELLLEDFDKPNGLAFSPEGTTLYCADTERGHVRAFDVNDDGSLREGRLFCRVERPDGMRVDAEGKLWIAARDGVRAFTPSGQAAGKIQVAEQPANLSFGDADLQTLYITARTSLYRFRLEVPGAA
jgi:sugar lactone lactonase YvrE